MSDLIDRQAAIDAIVAMQGQCTSEVALIQNSKIWQQIMDLPSAQPDFDITVKIDKAYDDGYEAGYLQGRHDWGDLDE